MTSSSSTTTKSRRRNTPARLILTPEQGAAIAEAYRVLSGLDTATGGVIVEEGHRAGASLRARFPSVFGDDVGGLFAATIATADAGPTIDVDPSPTPATYEPFNGSTTMAVLHPRVQAWVRSDTQPSRPPCIVVDPKWQLDCLWERWRYRIGEVEYGRWARTVRGAVQLYDFVDLWNAIEAYRESLGVRRTVNSLLGWLDSLPKFIEQGRVPYRNTFGDLTTRGRAVLGGDPEYASVGARR